MKETFSAFMFALNCVFVEILTAFAVYYPGNQSPRDTFIIVMLSQIFTILICVYFFTE